LIHQTLYQSNDFAHVDFEAFLRSFVPTLIQSYSLHPERIALSFHVNDVRLPIEAAVPCGLIVNELTSNALKHAFPEGRTGQITVNFEHDRSDHAILSVSDDGVGIPESFDFDRSETLGVQLVHVLAGQLCGAVTVRRAAPTQFVVRFPLAI
jgi:two-component sensor histidine kinase